jgi:hypothetical protein
MLTSQWALLLSQDSSSAARTAAVSLREVTLSADSASSHTDPLGSPSLVLTALRPARSHLAANTRKTSQLTVIWLLMQGTPTSLAKASPLWPELCQHSSSTLRLRVTALLRTPQYVTSYHTLCLPAHLYTFLLTAINICYRNLRGCLSMLLEPTSHTINI